MSTTPELLLAGGHSITAGYNNWKEEVHLYYRTEWRGESVVVTMALSRYQHSSGISEWRIYAQDARVGTEAHGCGPHLTDLAQSRLSAQLQPLAAEWLTTDAYRTSESLAYFHAVKRELGDATPYGGSKRAQQLLANYSEKFCDTQRGQLIEMCDAFDRFAGLYEAPAAPFETSEVR